MGVSCAQQRHSWHPQSLMTFYGQSARATFELNAISAWRHPPLSETKNSWILSFGAASTSLHDFYAFSHISLAGKDGYQLRSFSKRSHLPNHLSLMPFTSCRNSKWFCWQKNLLFKGNAILRRLHKMRALRPSERCCWRYRFLGALPVNSHERSWCLNVRGNSRFLGLSGHEDEGTTFVRNDDNCLPVDTV